MEKNKLEEIEKKAVIRILKESILINILQTKIIKWGIQDLRNCNFTRKRNRANYLIFILYFF